MRVRRMQYFRAITAIQYSIHLYTVQRQLSAWSVHCAEHEA